MAGQTVSNKFALLTFPVKGYVKNQVWLKEKFEHASFQLNLSFASDLTNAS